MNGYAASTKLLSEEEQKGLLDEKHASDTDSEFGNLEVDARHFVNRWTSAMKLPVESLASTHWRMLFLRLLMFLIPSFLQGRHAREQIRPAKLSPTAYLDGMRGLAALFVYFCHYSYQAFIIAKGWGMDEFNYHFLKLPFFRLFYQGPPAVCVFFVISGYALSYKPLKLARSRSSAELANTISSLVFRRGIRLFLPTAISTLMIVCLLQLGAYEPTREFANDRAFMKNIVEPHPAPMETIWAQFVDWLWQMYHFVHIFSWDKYGGQPQLDVHLWTIPVEFRCSLYLFLVLLGTARLQPKFRFIFVALISWFTYRNSRWELVLFYCGMLIAEMDLIRGAHVPAPALPVEEKTEKPSSKRLQSLFWTMLSILGLYLLCQPDDGGEITPGWRYLSSLIPEWWTEERFRYWQSTGAVVFVIAVSHSTLWQRFFNSFVVQYFGKLSYALYLMHGPAMHVVGYHWEKLAYSLTGVEGYWYNAGFFLGAAFCIPTVVWWADVFWRAVDIPTVRFARWFESKCIVKQ